MNEDEAKAKVWYDLKHPTPIRRNRPGESKRSRRARAEKKKAREETIQREEERREQARLATTGMQSLPSSSSPSNCYRLGKRNKKFVVIHSPVKSSAPRTHNYRRKVKVAEQKVINHYKNKASPGVGRESSLSEPTNPNKRRSLKFKRRLYRNMYHKKAVHPAPMVKYKEPYLEEIRFNEDDVDWDVLNEFVAIAKQEAVELELMVTKEREDEEETPSDTDKYDPVKEALDFLAVNGIAVGASVDHVEQIRSQRYRRPVHPATLMTEELRFYRLCQIVALIGASNTKFKRIIKNMRLRMLLNIKIRPRRSRLAITSYYTAKVEDILSKYMYNQRLRFQSTLEEREKSGGEKGGDDTLDTLSCTSSSSNTEDSIIDALDSKVSSSGYGNDSKKKTAPNQEEQAAPMSTNVDLSIPGAFTQYLHCNSKSCCSDAGCSSVGRTNHEIDTLDTLSSSSSSGEESMLECMKKDDKSGADTNTGEYQANV